MFINVVATTCSLVLLLQHIHRLLLQHVYQSCCWNVFINVLVTSVFINGAITKHQWCRWCNIDGVATMLMLISTMLLQTLVVLLQR
jgi:hypothetical protein